MRLNCWNLVKFLKATSEINRIQFRNAAKILYSAKEASIPLTHETLIGRMVMYLNADKEKPPEKTQDSSNESPSTWSKFKGDDKLALLHILENPQKRNRLLNSTILTQLDDECCRRLDDFNNKEILKILKTFMNIMPNRITNLEFYSLALQQLYYSFRDMDKTDLLRLIFYIGLQKKTVVANQMLKNILRYIDDEFIASLTAEELCIICISTFKTSTKVHNKKFLDKVKHYLNDNLCILKDPGVFSTLIKTIRQNKYQDCDLLATISCTIFFNKTYDLYTFPTLCHILALFSDYSYYDRPLIEFLSKKGIEQLKNSSYDPTKSDYLSVEPRAKDIQRMLWSLSNFRDFKHIDKTDLSEVVIPRIVERFEGGEFKNDASPLIEMLLFLWMLDYRPYELILQVLTNRNVQHIRAQLTKSKERLNLLLYSIYVEDRSFYNKLNMKPTFAPLLSVPYELKKRPLLQRVLKCLKSSTKNSLGLNKFEVTYEVPYIQIAGITGYKKNIYKTVYFEILDETTCLKNVEEDTPTGLMSFKMQLMNTFEEGLVTVCKQDVEDMTESELQEYLLDEMKLVSLY